MFDKDLVSKIALAGSLILLTSFFGKKIQQSFLVGGDKTSGDYELIKKYLLNEDGLFHFNRPNLWIHTKYELNARKWKSFGSRNTFDLNQPYIHLAIKSIIHECGRDFNICLIDDESFARLIPGWNYDLSMLAEPFRTHYRELAMMKILYEYGGILMPNSFLCFRNFAEIYQKNMSVPFVAENLSRTAGALEFSPDIHFMGAKKKCSVIGEMISYVEARNKYPHYTSEFDLVGDLSIWCAGRVKERRMHLLSADMIGAMTANKKPIRLDNLMEEDYLELSRGALGIYIPADEILRRPKFQWFASISSEDVLRGDSILSKYFISVYDKIASAAASLSTQGNNDGGILSGADKTR